MMRRPYGPQWRDEGFIQRPSIGPDMVDTGFVEVTDPYMDPGFAPPDPIRTGLGVAPNPMADSIRRRVLRLNAVAGTPIEAAPASADTTDTLPPMPTPRKPGVFERFAMPLAQALGSEPYQREESGLTAFLRGAGLGFSAVGQQRQAQQEAEQDMALRLRQELLGRRKDERESRYRERALDIQERGVAATERRANQPAGAASRSEAQMIAEMTPEEFARYRQRKQALLPAREPAPPSWSVAGNLTGPNGEPVQIDPRTGRLRILPLPEGVKRTAPSAGKPATEAESRVYGFFKRAEQAAGDLESIKEVPGEMERAMVGRSFLNRFTSPQAQMFDNATRQFINAVLRRDSGAVISDDEFASAQKEYIPVPGDSPQVLERKRQNRRTALEALRVGAGRLLDSAADGEPDLLGNVPGLSQ